MAIVAEDVDFICVEFVFQKKQVTLKAQSILGEVDASAEAASSEEFKFYLNGRFLHYWLSSIKGERVRIGFINNKTPVRFAGQLSNKAELLGFIAQVNPR
jgi:hypothetical protein